MDIEEIYQQYQHKVFRLCLGYTNDVEWAKDLVQETFIQVHLHLKKFRSESSIGTWVYRIAVNICLRQIERANKQKMVKSDMVQSSGSEKIDEELIGRLYDAIATLEHSDRLIITMVLEGVKNPEIAEILGVNEGNIRVKIHRIKKQLSKIIA